MTAQNTVNSVIVFKPTKTWPTKSGGSLSVLYTLPIEILNRTLLSSHYDNSKAPSPDIRGLRSYKIDGLRKGAIGANEWHKIRYELIQIVKGSISLYLIDLCGESKQIVIPENGSVLVPPYILHKYTVLENDTIIIVTASTTFDPDDPSTHDTYNLESFTNVLK